jgi:hypothetical protein
MAVKKQAVGRKDDMTWQPCDICGKPVVFDGAWDVCTDCRPKREKEYSRILLYLREHMGADVNTVSAATGVSGSVVLKLMRRGSITTAKAKLKCQRCGKLILEGRLCSSCDKHAQGKSRR